MKNESSEISESLKFYDFSQIRGTITLHTGGKAYTDF